VNQANRSIITHSLRARFIRNDHNICLIEQVKALVISIHEVLNILHKVFPDKLPIDRKEKAYEVIRVRGLFFEGSFDYQMYLNVCDRLVQMEQRLGVPS
jgi:hypothetical protein